MFYADAIIFLNAFLSFVILDVKARFEIIIELTLHKTLFVQQQSHPRVTFETYCMQEYVMSLQKLQKHLAIHYWAIVVADKHLHLNIHLNTINDLWKAYTICPSK